MAQPTLNQSHIDEPLTNVVVAYLQDPNKFIAGQVFPRLPVDFKTDLYWTFPKEAFFRDDMRRRAPGTESEGSGWTLSTDSYSCDVWALHKDLDNQTLNNTDKMVDQDMVAAKWLMAQALQRQEAQFVTDYLTTSVWATDKVGGTDFPLWSNYTTSNPINDIDGGKEAIALATGMEPNVLVIGYEVFRYLKNHPDLIDRIKFVQRGQITEDLLASLLEVDKVLVARAIKNTAEEGQTFAGAFHFRNSALLCYSNPEPGLMAPSAGYQFVWTGVSDGMGAEVGISRIPAPLIKSERIEIEMAWDNKVVGTDLGYFFSAAV